MALEQNLLVTILLFSLSTVSAKYTGPTNEAGLLIVKTFEDYNPRFSRDPTNKLMMIGYGHVCGIRKCPEPINGKYMIPISRADADSLLKEDLQPVESCINSAVTWNNLTPNQFSSLVSFTFSVGCGNLQNSALLKFLNEGLLAQASNEFKNWNKINGKLFPRYVRRRKAERLLFDGFSDGAMQQ